MTNADNYCTDWPHHKVSPVVIHQATTLFQSPRALLLFFPDASCVIEMTDAESLVTVAPYVSLASAANGLNRAIRWAGYPASDIPALLASWAKFEAKCHCGKGAK